MSIEKDDIIINLYTEKLEVDFKEGVLQRVENVIEENPLLEGSLGFLMQSVFPLDVLLRDIEDVERTSEKLKIIIPMRRDIELPLSKAEVDILYAKLKELIPIEKNKYYNEIYIKARAREEAEREKWGKVGRIT